MCRKQRYLDHYEIQSGDLEGGLERVVFVEREGDQENISAWALCAQMQPSITGDNWRAAHFKIFDDYIRLVRALERPFILVSLLLSSAQYR